MAQSAPPLLEVTPELFSLGVKRNAYVNLAVARDSAFNFYYPDNLDFASMARS